MGKSKRELLRERLIVALSHNNAKEMADAIIQTIDELPKPAKPKVEAKGRIVAFYCDGWMARHKSSKAPLITGKTAGMLSKLVDEFGEQRVMQLIDAWFKMPDAFAVKARHPVDLLVRKINEVVAWMDTGSHVTNFQAQQVDRSGAAADQLRRIEEGSL